MEIASLSTDGLVCLCRSYRGICTILGLNAHHSNSPCRMFKKKNFDCRSIMGRKLLIGMLYTSHLFISHPNILQGSNLLPEGGNHFHLNPASVGTGCLASCNKHHSDSSMSLFLLSVLSLIVSLHATSLSLLLPPKRIIYYSLLVINL